MKMILKVRKRVAAPTELLASPHLA